MVSHDLKWQIAKYKSQTKTQSQTKNSKRMSSVELLLTGAYMINYVGSFCRVKHVWVIGNWVLDIFCEVFK